MKRKIKAKKATQLKTKKVRTATTAVVAEVFDIDPSTVQRWVTDGLPHTKGKSIREGNRFDLGEVAAWKRTNGISGEVGRPPEKMTTAGEKIRERKELALCRRYEIQVERELDELVAIVDVRAKWAEIGNLIRTQMQSLSSSILPIALRYGMPNAGAVKFQSEAQSLIDQALAVIAQDGRGDAKTISAN